MESLKIALSKPSAYREIDGEKYVLVTHAMKNVVGASNDAINLIHKFVQVYRPEDTDLHDAIKSLFHGVKND